MALEFPLVDKCAVQRQIVYRSRLGNLYLVLLWLFQSLLGISIYKIDNYTFKNFFMATNLDTPICIKGIVIY